MEHGYSSTPSYSLAVSFICPDATHLARRIKELPSLIPAKEPEGLTQMPWPLWLLGTYTIIFGYLSPPGHAGSFSEALDSPRAGRSPGVAGEFGRAQALPWTSTSPQTLYSTNIDNQSHHV